MKQATGILLGVASLFAAVSSNVFAAGTSLPAINNVGIKLLGTCPATAEICPAVEPWTEISFSYKSCATMDFEIEVAPASPAHASAVHEVSITLKQNVDCFGPAIWREYSLQLDSLADPSAQYVVLNPLSLSLDKF